MTIAERIRRWREGRDLSRAALAEAVGVSRQTIQQWEAGVHPPTHGNIEKIITAIGVSLPVFWGEPPAAKARKAS